MSLVPLLRNNVFDPNNLDEFEKWTEIKGFDWNSFNSWKLTLISMKITPVILKMHLNLIDSSFGLPLYLCFVDAKQWVICLTSVGLNHKCLISIHALLIAPPDASNDDIVVIYCVFFVSVYIAASRWKKVHSWNLLLQYPCRWLLHLKLAKTSMTFRA